MQNNKQEIFITATNTNVGKTYASEQFLKYYARQGLSVGYFKPFETGVTGLPVDGSLMLSLVKKLNPKFVASIDEVVPYQFKLPASPFVANTYEKDKHIDIDFLKAKKDYLLTLCDVLVIEGAGGLMVPIKKDYFIIDLIKDFSCKAILISPSKLGCINDTLLSLQVLESKKIIYDWYINLFEEKDTFYQVSYPFYKNYFNDIKFLDSIK